MPFHAPKNTIVPFSYYYSYIKFIITIIYKYIAKIIVLTLIKLKINNFKANIIIMYNSFI